MAITPGFTLVEIRDFVNEYQMARHGQKAAWLELHGISRSTIGRWRLAVFEGDLDRGLIPREGRVMTISPSERTALAHVRAAELRRHDKEIAVLNERIRELEDISAALGKAIGLLHARGAQEPGTPPNSTSPSPS